MKYRDWLVWAGGGDGLGGRPGVRVEILRVTHSRRPGRPSLPPSLPLSGSLYSSQLYSSLSLSLSPSSPPDETRPAGPGQCQRVDITVTGSETRETDLVGMLQLYFYRL
jgi:hypothetical protein